MSKAASTMQSKTFVILDTIIPPTNFYSPSKGDALLTEL